MPIPITDARLDDALAESFPPSDPSKRPKRHHMNRIRQMTYVLRLLAGIGVAAIGAVVLVHWGRWNFVPTESHPMGGIEFQVFLGLVMLYLVVVGNRAIRPVGTR
ncbi:MAG: hypothetical protein O7C65_04710 [Planctomycetota bacterium]|nr:hypothetical protein [Planctomycetota bacterium]